MREEKKKIYKAIPATDAGSTVTCKVEEKTYLITNCQEKQRFTLWKVDNGYEKIAVDDSPIPLYDKIPGFTN